MRGRMLSNIVWLFLERVIVTAAVLGSNIYVVRSLGTSKFGDLSYLQAIFGLATVAADFGLRRVLMVSFGRAASGPLVSATLLLKVLVSAVLLIGFLFAYFRGGNEGFLQIALFAAFAPLEVYTFVLQAELKNDLLAKTRTGLALLGAGVRVWLCIEGLGTVNALLLTYVLQFVILFVLAWLWTKLDVERTWHISFRRLARVLRLSRITLSKSMYYFFSMMIIQAHYRVDQIMISKIAGSAELGIYASAYKLVEQLLMIPGIISAVLLPRLALDRKRADLTRQRLSTVYATTMLASIGVAIPIMLTADPVIHIAFGPEFVAAGRVLFYLMMGVPFLFLANMSGLYFSVFGKERQAFIRNLSGLCVNILLNLFMIPRFGATGAAISTVVSYFMVAFGAEVVFWKRFGEHLAIKWVAIKSLFSLHLYKDVISVLRGK